MGLKNGLKSILFLFLLLVSCFYFSSPAQAHHIETDGSVLIMLHTSDDDNPIVGKSVDLTFYITDSQKKFKAPECDCRLEITLNDQIVFSTTSFKNIKNNAIFSYTFPQKGIYAIKFTANPLIKDSFQSFKFNYEMRIDRSLEQAIAAKASMNKYRLYLVLGFIVLLILLFNYKKLNKRIFGVFVVFLAIGLAFHSSQIFCPDHAHGNQASQHDCCFVPVAENNVQLSVSGLIDGGIKKTKLQQPVKVKLIFGLNNKSPPQSV